jgi:ATP-binding cassette subfamily B protein
LRKDLYEKAIGAEVGEFDRLGAPTLITRLSNDVGQIQNFVNGLMRIFVKAPIMAIGGAAMALSMTPSLAPILLCSVLAAAILVALNVRLCFPLYGRLQADIDGINEVLGERLSGIRVVKAFGRREEEITRFEEANGRLAASTSKAMGVSALFPPGIALALNASLAAVLWLGSAGSGIGRLVATVNYLIQTLTAFNMVSWIVTAFNRGKASAQRVGEGLALRGDFARAAAPFAATAPSASDDAVDAAESQEARRGVPALEFRGIDFAYPASDVMALRGVSASVSRGEVLGVIGPTGSGKSTLASLALRFYEPRSGTLLLDGRDARGMDPGRLRAAVSLVPQEPILFSRSVLENLLWGNEEATEAEAARAAEAAQAHSFVQELPEGYASLVGRGGVNLSGGQKQRLCIARALLRRPEVLILDDAFGSLDALTEESAKAAMAPFLERMAVILIAQRVSSVMRSDRILVLDDGYMAGYGPHEELIEDCPVYRDMWLAQIGNREVRHA